MTGILLSYIGEISFPLFLIHYPLLVLISYLKNRGVAESLAILLYLLICISLSSIVLRIDKSIPRDVLVKKVICRARSLSV